MKRRDFSTLIATAPFAGAALAQGGPVEGRQYLALASPQPTTPGKIDVIEFFWYGCPHCYAFEPIIEGWAKQQAADVAYRKVHVAFRANVKIHQRMFFALEAMGKEVATRPAIFAAMHQRGMTLEDVKSQAQFLSSIGIDGAKYTEAYNSFGVQNKCTQAEKMQDAYRIDGVPTVAIGGRFLTSPGQVGAGQRLPEDELGRRAVSVMDFLVSRVRNKT